jgi:signal transduction histidine kinase
MFSGKDGVQVGAVTSIQSEGTKVWIGGELGLEFFDGSRFQPVSPSDGSAFGDVSGIVADPDNGLWFSDNRAIIHIPEDQLRQSGPGKVEFESFGLLDGLTAQLRGPLASPSAVQTTDGLIWFATTTGVAWINPKRIVRNPVLPPVSIESVIANGRKYNGSTFLRLPAHTANLQIAYTATSLTVPERVRFRFMLEGQDKEWQEAGMRREAFYTNLAPGSYQFHVIACNNDGVWNSTGASVGFSIVPAYYQTGWFRAACVALFMVLVWMLYQLRVRSVEQRYLERSRAEEELRRAREELAHIHRVSTMGELTAAVTHEVKQPIAAAVTNAKTCLRWLNRDQPDLPEARDAAARLVKDVTRASDIISRIGSLFKKGLPSREILNVNEIIREMIALLRSEAARHSISVDSDLGGDVPQIMADRVQLQQVLMNLMLNGMEAMTNLSAPGRLTIRSRREGNGQLLISVADVGTGINPEQAEQIFRAFFTSKPQGTGMGLAISRSIVESHGGRLWASPNSGPGTTFHFTLPIETKPGEPG